MLPGMSGEMTMMMMVMVVMVGGGDDDDGGHYAAGHVRWSADHDEEHGNGADDFASTFQFSTIVDHHNFIYRTVAGRLDNTWKAFASGLTSFEP